MIIAIYLLISPDSFRVAMQLNLLYQSIIAISYKIPIYMKRKLHQSLSMKGQGETESRTVATVNSRFEFTFVVNESVTSLWPG